MKKVKELILKNRSYRRFHEDFKISFDDLHDWIDNARLSRWGNRRKRWCLMIYLKMAISSIGAMRTKYTMCPSGV
jgi:hypothetical protein